MCVAMFFLLSRDEKSRGLNIEGMLADISAAPLGSIIMLHGRQRQISLSLSLSLSLSPPNIHHRTHIEFAAAAHNPTGVDPTEEQWKRIAAACHANANIVWFDSAYQVSFFCG